MILIPVSLLLTTVADSPNRLFWVLGHIITKFDFDLLWVFRDVEYSWPRLPAAHYL